MELFYFEWFRVIRKRFDGIWLVDTIWKSFPAIAPFLIWEQWTGFQSWLLSIFSSISIELDRFFCGRDSDFEEPNQSIESNRFDRLEKVLPAFPFFGATVILHFFSKFFLSFLCCCWKKSFPSLNTIGFFFWFLPFQSKFTVFFFWSLFISDFIHWTWFYRVSRTFFLLEKKEKKSGLVFADSNIFLIYFYEYAIEILRRWWRRLLFDGDTIFERRIVFFFLWWTFVLIFIFFCSAEEVNKKKRPPKTGKPNKNKNETTPSRRRADKRRKSEKERKKERKKERIIPQILELSPRCRARRAPDGRRHVTEMKNQKKTPKNHQKTRKCGSYRVFLPSFSDTATEGLRKKRSPPLETHFR